MILLSFQGGPLHTTPLTFNTVSTGRWDTSIPRFGHQNPSDGERPIVFLLILVGNVHQVLLRFFLGGPSQVQPVAHPIGLLGSMFVNDIIADVIAVLKHP